MNARVSARTADMFAEALHNATTSQSVANYASIYEGFAAKGIDDVQPRVNVFTFNAWKALGRSVKKGEHGVKVCTWVPMTKKDESGEAQPIGRKPRMTTVFHLSQTDPSKYPNRGEVNAADLAEHDHQAAACAQATYVPPQHVEGDSNTTVRGFSFNMQDTAAPQNTALRFVTVGSDEVAL